MTGSTMTRSPQAATDTSDTSTILRLTPAEISLLVDALASLHVRGRGAEILDFVRRHPEISIFTDQTEPAPEEDR